MGQSFNNLLPQPGDGLRILEAKILLSIKNIQGGGTGGAGITGIGSPQGVVTAPPGTNYLDTSGGFFWVKESGVGNTGWLQLL